MYKKKGRNMYYYEIELAQPSNLREVKALINLGFCVRNLDEKAKKDYLDISEYSSLREFRKEYDWRDIEDWIQIEEIKKEIGTYGSFYFSDMEGGDTFIVFREDLDDVFYNFLEASEQGIIREAMQIYYEENSLEQLDYIY